MTLQPPWLTRLKAQYFALYPPRLIALPAPASLQLARSQDALWRALIEDERLSATPPARDYQRKFWKRVVQALEEELRQDEAVEEELELDDRLMEHYHGLMCDVAEDADRPPASYKTYIYRPGPPRDRQRSASPTRSGSCLAPKTIPEDERAQAERMMTLREAQTTIEAGSTGLRTWTASLHLAEQVLLDPSILSNPLADPTQTDLPLPPILELGSGTGFLALFLAQLGCPSVVATDLGEADDAEGWEEGGFRRPLGGLKGNLELNRGRVPIEVQAKHLDWQDAVSSPDQGTSALKPYMQHLLDDLLPETVLIAADVIYDPELVPPLAASLGLFLRHPHCSRAIVAATVRNPDTLAVFERACAERGLSVRAIRRADADAEPEEQRETVFWNANTWEGSDVRLMYIRAE